LDPNSISSIILKFIFAPKNTKKKNQTIILSH
jgi:hypothetical protein